MWLHTSGMNLSNKLRLQFVKIEYKFGVKHWTSIPCCRVLSQKLKDILTATSGLRYSITFSTTPFLDFNLLQINIKGYS